MPPRHYVTPVNLKEVVPASILYIACEDAAGGGSFIAFSHSSWNN